MMKNCLIGGFLFLFVSIGGTCLSVPAVKTQEVLRQIYKEKVTNFHYYSAYADAAARGNQPVFAAMFELMAEAELLHAAKVSQLFEDTKDSVPEPIQTTVHASTIEKNLEISMKIEEVLINKRYSAWLSKIRDEHQQEALEAIMRVWRVDKRHFLLLQYMRTVTHDKAYLRIKKFAYCQICGYIDFQVPKRFCPVCYHNPTYFILRDVDDIRQRQPHEAPEVETNTHDFQVYTFE